MPCTYTGSLNGDAIHFLKQDKEQLSKEVLDLTQMLCLMCKKSEKEGTKIPKRVAKWWKKHKEQDEKGEG